MFEGNSTSKGQGQSGAGQQLPNASSPLTTPKQVYTMPEKFMQPRAVSKGKPKKWMIIVGICVAVLLVFVAIIVYAFQTASNNVVVNENTNTVTNVNLNTNRNSNRNSNTNINGNENENTNSGSVLNFNVNENVGNNINNGLFPNSNSNANSNVNSGIPLPDRSDAADGRDKDRDGLTDIEEDIYSTRFDQPDTDKDGYVDGTEVRNLFSPSDPDKTLLESGAVIAYTQPDFGWGIDYPADWIAEPVNDSHAEVIFSSDSVDGEFVEVLAVDNTKHETAAEWYASLYEDIDPSDLETASLGGLQGIVSPDGFAYYLADDTYIIGVIYNFGTKDQIQFRTTFEMMAASFTYTPVSSSTSTNSNVNSNNSNTNSGTNANDNSNTNS